MLSERGPRRLAGAVCVVAIVVGGCADAPRGSSEPTAAPSSPGGPGPSATVVQQTAHPDPTPWTTTIEGLVATKIPLGQDAAPIDVAVAFGSIWVANHHANSVIRLDPGSFSQQAVVPVAAGPGWFAVTDDAIWVSSQLGRGLTRIDVATNSADVRAGSWASCGAPVAFDGHLWQMACDAGVLMRIDPATNQAIDITAAGFSGVAVLDGTLVAQGPDGLARVDPEQGSLEPVGGPAGFLAGFDDRSAYVTDELAIHRVGADGAVLADIAIPGEVAVTVAGDRAWVTSFVSVVDEVELGSNRTLRTLHVPSPAVARQVEGVLWVTSFDGDAVWRIEP